MKMKKVWRILSIVVAIVLALGMTAFAEGDAAVISAGVVEAEAGQKVKGDVVVENNYPIPEDIKEEKELDIAEVEGNIMSRKYYMKKWM